MSLLEVPHAPVAKAAMLIRKPIAEVFAAFADPAITTKFWFTASSGPLVAGESVKWTWDMYDFSLEVAVKVVDAPHRLVLEWPGAHGVTTVVWHFTDRGDGTTFVEVVHGGFRGDGDQVIAQVVDSTEGFAIVLSALKALLEHGIQLNSVRDRFPKGLPA